MGRGLVGGCCALLPFCMLLVLLALQWPALAQGGGTVSYSYDDQGRLTGATYSDGASITYAYDPAGNRTKSAASGGAPPIANPVSATVALELVEQPHYVEHHWRRGHQRFGLDTGQ